MKRWVHIHPPPLISGSIWPFIKSVLWNNKASGLDLHLRIDYLQKDASICPPSWLGRIIACLPVIISDAKSLQMLHHFLSPVPVIFQPFLFFIFYFSLSVHNGHSLKEVCLCYSQTHSYLVALLFSLNTPGKSGCVSDIVFVLLTNFFFLFFFSNFSSTVCSLPRCYH